MTTTGENHQLSEYLNEILPTLALDPETYIPYITGCLDILQEDEEFEELDEIISLLQASSETHSDNEEIWPPLKQAILAKHLEYKAEANEKKQLELEQRKELEALKKKEDYEQAILERERKKLAEEEKALKNAMDPAKRALINQYAYDDSEMYDNDGKLVDAAAAAGAGKGKEVEEEDTSNRGLAQKMVKEQAQQLRGAGGPTKREEQQKTKSAKMDKVNKKEERRKRAVKGERKS